MTEKPKSSLKDRIVTYWKPNEFRELVKKYNEVKEGQGGDDIITLGKIRNEAIVQSQKYKKELYKSMNYMILGVGVMFVSDFGIQFNINEVTDYMSNYISNTIQSDYITDYAIWRVLDVADTVLKSVGAAMFAGGLYMGIRNFNLDFDTRQIKSDLEKRIEEYR